jgi:hypothetical protein
MVLHRIYDNRADRNEGSEGIGSHVPYLTTLSISGLQSI